jgi:hypothetical protein
MGLLSFVVVLCTLLTIVPVALASDPMTRAKEMVQQMTLREKYVLM